MSWGERYGIYQGYENEAKPAKKDKKSE